MNAKKTWVISLGGSRIIPENVDDAFLKNFKKLLLTHKGHKFVVVTGGGTTARKYIDALKDFKMGHAAQSNAGIAITRFHAIFMMNLFGKPANEELPVSIKKVKNLLKKNQVVFCGALRERHDQTTDATSAQVAANIGCPFINITNVKGLYTSNPKKHKDAKLIREISWSDFSDIAKKIKFSAGQHFVLDQKASEVIKKRKIKTFITNSLADIKGILNGKRARGTTIYG